MSKRLLFVFNPRSGKGQIKNELFDIIDVFVKAGYEVVVHPTQGTMDACKCVKELAERMDLIVCSGGDGTLNEVVTAIEEVKVNVPVGYIPAGSTNDFANSLDIPKNMMNAAKNIIDGKLYSLDVGTFNDETFVYVAAFGMLSEVSYETNQNLKNILGHLAYILKGAQKIFDMKGHKVRIEANGNVYEDEYIHGMITNSYSVGGFQNITGTDIEMDDGLFEVTLIKKPKNVIELNEIIFTLLSAYDNSDMIDTFKTHRLEVFSEEPLAWTLDGEFGGEITYAKIKNKKQALDIVINP